MPVYLVAAYAVFWGLTFALVFSIWARQRRLERELQALQATRKSETPSVAMRAAAHPSGAPPPASDPHHSGRPEISKV